MIQAVQHVPGFVTGVEPSRSDVATTADLLLLPWVKRYEEDPSFFRWSQSEGYLMAEYEDGRRWWVAARVSGDPLELPTWKAAKS